MLLLSCAPLREHVSQADYSGGCTCSGGLLKGLAKRAKATATRTSILPVVRGYYTGGVASKKTTFLASPLYLARGRGFEPRDRQRFFNTNFDS